MVTPMTFTICKAKSPLEAVNTILAGGGETEIIPSFPRYGRYVDPLWDDLDFSRLDCSGDLWTVMLSEDQTSLWIRGNIPGEHIPREITAAAKMLPRLTSLMLAGDGIGDVVFLSEMPSITHLVLWDLHREGPLTLGAMPNLQLLGIYNCSMSRLEGLSSLGGLTSLTLQDNDLPALPDLGEMPSLRQLICIDDPAFRSGGSLRDIRGISRLRSLQSLHLIDLPDLQDISPIRFLTTLEELTLRLSQPWDLQMLTHFPELVRLRASVSPEVRRALEQTLANCPKLSDVKIVERPRKPQKDGGDGEMAASDSDSDLLAAHRFCTGNKEQLMNGRICGCFYCLSIYDPKEIHEWIDNGTTGLCPYCGVDAILSENCGYPITKEFLQKMQRRWFDVNHN